MEDLFMKKNFMLMITVVLVMALLAGCAGTVVVVGDCTCPTEGGNVTVDTQPVVGDGETLCERCANHK
jgi:predicted small secreted protein